MGEIETELKRAKDRAFSAYRNHKRYLARVEKRLVQTPTPALELECAERRGILKGIWICWDAIEVQGGAAELPLGGLRGED